MKTLRQVKYVAQVIYRRPKPNCNWTPKAILLFDAVSGEAMNTAKIAPSCYDVHALEYLMSKLFKDNGIEIESKNLLMMPAMYLEPKEFDRHVRKCTPVVSKALSITPPETVGAIIKRGAR